MSGLCGARQGFPGIFLDINIGPSYKTTSRKKLRKLILQRLTLLYMT